MTRSAGWIDEGNTFEADLGDRWLQRAIEKKFLHEFRSLKKCIALAGRFGEVLVEVAQKAGVPALVLEIMNQRPGIRIDLAAKINNCTRTVGRRTKEEEWIVALIKERRGGRPILRLTEAREKVFSVGSGRLTNKKLIMAVARLIEASPGPGKPRFGQEAVVLQEANEDGGEHPMNRDLGQALITPCPRALPGPALLSSPLVFSAERGGKLGMLRKAVAEVVFEQTDKALAAREETGKARSGGRRICS